MAIKKPIVITNGNLEQLQAGDILAPVPNTLDLINGETFELPKGTPVYLSTADTVKVAVASDIITTQIIALGIIPTAASSTGTFQLNGKLSLTTTEWDVVTGETGGLVPGAVYFLGPSSSPGLRRTAPTNVGDFVVKVGTAINVTDFAITIGTPIKL